MGKPTCKKCGSQHWGFVPCDQAAEVTAREAAQAAVRAKTQVVPVPAHDRTPAPGLKNFVQVGNRFVRKER